MRDVFDVETERSQLTAMAYRMLGTVADAEDAVQETYARWFRMPEDERAAVRSPGAWLGRTVGRVCLDVLGSARMRREHYVGEWLPEPVPAHSDLVTGSRSGVDPLEVSIRNDAVSTALLLVLEALTPAERVAFVLHDVFDLSFAEIAAAIGRSEAATRQLASSARRHIRQRRARMASREHHDALVRAFAAASLSGDYHAVVRVLAPDVVLHSDGGGAVSAARRPVLGADRVARFLLGLPHLQPGTVLEPVATPDGLGFLARTASGQVHSVWTAGVEGDRVTDVWIVVNPAKLTLWA
ncbi:RNA polymerase sigma factor SigJ [Microbacterium lushaniae]|uniref:RNA polymerase sigma factor SigJ n=1 Tax=Microbacterium lushaniae TaxID=2614639 RepID=UPI001EE7A160|nr:RNA polymerase sigma factor SigJ [Microbacterium lushaniae]